MYIQVCPCFSMTQPEQQKVTDLKSVKGCFIYSFKMFIMADKAVKSDFAPSWACWLSIEPHPTLWPTHNALCTQTLWRRQRLAVDNRGATWHLKVEFGENEVTREFSEGALEKLWVSRHELLCVHCHFELRTVVDSCRETHLTGLPSFSPKLWGPKKPIVVKYKKLEDGLRDWMYC